MTVLFIVCTKKTTATFPFLWYFGLVTQILVTQILVTQIRVNISFKVHCVSV